MAEKTETAVSIPASVLLRIENFKDPRQEWRRLFSELYGTFFLVIVAAGGGMMSQAFPGTIVAHRCGRGAGPDGARRSSCSWARSPART